MVRPAWLPTGSSYIRCSGSGEPVRESDCSLSMAWAVPVALVALGGHGLRPTQLDEPMERAPSCLVAGCRPAAWTDVRQSPPNYPVLQVVAPLESRSNELGGLGKDTQ